MCDVTLPKVRLTDYAPSGVLRIAINHGNRVLAGRDAEGRAIGISVDLAEALAIALDTAPTLVEYERAGDVSASADQDAWDVCFLAVDPERADKLDFTQPYIRIDGSYLVAPGLDVRTSEDVVERALRVGSVRGSAYSLHLARRPGSENLVLFPSMGEAIAAFDAGAVQALAGIRKAMNEIATPRPGTNVVDPPFMEIRQAMALPKGRKAAHAHLSALLGGLLASGEVRSILERHGIDGDAAMEPNQIMATRRE